MRRALLFSFFFFLFGKEALAGLHLEPYGGYGITLTNADPFPVRSDSHLLDSLNYTRQGKLYHGISGGVRLGYTRLGLAGGVDFTADWLSGREEALVPVLAGLFVSYKLPLLFRVYGSFIPGGLDRLPLNRVHVTGRAGNANFSCHSYGGKAGVSYMSLPFVSVNFEYRPLKASAPCGNQWFHSLIAYINLTL